jgi:hypothetical protein
VLLCVHGDRARAGTWIRSRAHRTHRRRRASFRR